MTALDRASPSDRRPARARPLTDGSDSRNGLDGARAASGSRELPLVHRLAMAYLLAPVAVWLLGWLHWWVGVPATALLAVGAWKALSGSWRWRRPSRATVVLVLAAGAWVMTTPAGGVFTFGGGDWLSYRTILLDLSRGGWPTYPVDYLHDAPPLLRYYLGWYIVPSLAARWLGPWALDWAVSLWTWCGAALVVLLFARGLPTLRAALLAVAVLVFFSGMDIVELVLREGVPDAVRMIRDRLDPTWEIPRWQDRRIEFVRTTSSPMLLEYQSHTLTLQMTPHHFLPAGIATLLILQLRERRRFLEAVGVVLAACLFWSSLLSTGLLVLAVAGLAKNRKARHAANWRNVAVAVPLAALIALYLTSGPVDFERGWLWQLYDDRFRMATDILLLYATEFVVLAALLWRLDPQAAREPPFVAAVAMLLVAPWYYYGSAVFSEWSIRFTIPALMVLAYWAARAVVGTPPASRARTARHALLAVLAAGAVTVVWDIGLMMHNPILVPYEDRAASFPTDLDTKRVREVGSPQPIPAPLAALLRDRQPDEADKGTLLIRSAWDVYLRDNRLVYVARRCRRGDGQTRTHFYAHVYPADPRALLPGSAAAGPEPLAFRLVSWRHYKPGGSCVVPLPLPDYEIARIKTGQTAADGHAIWEADAHLTPNPPMDGPEAER